MVNDESKVLPTAVVFESGKAASALSLVNKVASLSISRSCRPCHDNGWINDDHYTQSNEPSDSFNVSEWKEVYKDLDKIRVNGAIKRQWMRAHLQIVVEGRKSHDNMRNQIYTSVFCRDSCLFWVSRTTWVALAIAMPREGEANSFAIVLANGLVMILR